MLFLSYGVVVYAETFVNPSTLSVDGVFSDWGSAGSPSNGVYLGRDASNNGEQDGSGFSGKESDINYAWTALSSQIGGVTPVGSSNLIEYVYYRIDTFWDSEIGGQSYYIKLNLGVANPGYADHLLQMWVDNANTPNITIILYEYSIPYPQIDTFTSGAIIGKVSNVVNPYTGFSGVHDTNAIGALGVYDGTNYGIEVRIPINWYSSTYGGAVKADGTGAKKVIGALFTGTGLTGSVGAIKDSLNDAEGKTLFFVTSINTGDTDFVTKEINKLNFITPAQNIVANNISSIIMVQTCDGMDIPRNVTVDTVVDLSSTSTAGVFDVTQSGAFNGSITSVIIESGSNSVSFYYKDSVAGTPTIMASENPNQGWTDAAQQETIHPGTLNHILISPDTTSITAGKNQTCTTEAFDKYNNSLGDISSYTTFSIENDAGGNFTNNTYTSENVGVWTITGSYNEISDTTVLTVNPGTLNHFVI
jgi:adhesin/invasin